MLASSVTGLTLAVIYGCLAVLSMDPGTEDLLSSFLFLYVSAAGVMFAYWHWLGRTSSSQISFKTVLAWAVLFRIIGIYADPILEDDFHRYMLDACLFVTYGTPYGISPISLFIDNSLPPQCETLLTWVNNPDLPTIYAPFLQYVYLLAYWLSPVNLDVIQLFTVLFDLCVIALLSRLATARMVMLYAWCPLIIKEFAITAHPDVIGVALLLAAFVFRQHQKPYYAFTLIGLACCTKVLALAALPFFLYRAPLRFWAISLGTIVLLYLPFLSHQSTDLDVLVYFANNWMFNASLFLLFREIFSDHVARYVCFALFATSYLLYWIRFHKCQSRHEIPRMDWIFGILFLLSPVLNAWYLVWILPFAVMWPSVWAWTASVVLVFSYAVGLHLPASTLGAYQVAPVAQIIQIVAVGIALFIDNRRGRINLNFARTTQKE